jgi:hypothetical protein
VKAKTYYPPRPATWNPGKDWPADVAFTLIQADLLRGKSIGFLPVKVHAPTKTESEQWAVAAERQEARGVGREPSRATSSGSPLASPRSRLGLPTLIIDEWILLEYACVFLPAQQNAVIESVSKSAAEVVGEDKPRIARMNTNELIRFDSCYSWLASLPVEFQKALGVRGSLYPGSETARAKALVFTRLSEFERAIQRRIEAVDLGKLIEARIDVLRGRV